ncbi:MAG: NFACT RNA binding domain-containing protein [Fidelibacterota bacterium]
MYNSWFHIRAIAQYLQSGLPDAVISDCYTYQKDELVIRFADSDPLQGIQLAFHPPLPGLQPETELALPKQRVVLFKELTGERIHSVKWHRSDRQILISLKNDPNFLLLQLFGINGNVFLLDRDFRILDSFRKSRKEITVQAADFTARDSLHVPEPAFKQILADHPDLNIIQIVSRLPIPIFGTTLTEELCYRSGLSDKTLVTNLSNEQIGNFFHHYNHILAEIEQNRTFVYESEAPLFSLLALKIQLSVPCESFTDLTAASRHYVALFYQTYNREQLRKLSADRLTLALQQFQRRLRRQEQELQNLPTATEYREWADTLLANIHHLQNYTDTIKLPKLTNPGQTLRILLNPKLTIAENANKFYEKSRQIENSRKELQDSIRNAREAIQTISALLERVRECRDLKMLQQIQRQIPVHLIQQRPHPEPAEREPFYRFYLQNREILVGKSARDNDLLSFKHARPDDFWFHAEHGPGSHVVVRNPGKQASLPPDIIEYAAGVAAFYSKAKHSGLVPVIYTKKKYIWKRKNMPPGKVFTKFTKSVIVKPLDPRKLS